MPPTSYAANREANPRKLGKKSSDSRRNWTRSRRKSLRCASAIPSCTLTLLSSTDDRRPIRARPAREAARPAGRQRRGRGGSVEPFVHSVYDAGFWVDGTDPDLTMLDIKPGVPHDLRVLPGGNVAKPGDVAPRGFLTVLAKGDPAFHHGSGRLELAEKIFTDAAALTARVIVNRVWAWHFGKADRRDAKRFRRSRRKTDPSAAARRFGGALYRQRLVAQMAAPRNHAFLRLSAGEPSARRCRQDRSRQSACFGG